MGVMGCSRLGCENIMCDHHVWLGINEFFYICDSCLAELHLHARTIPMGTDQDVVRDFVRDFFSTGKPGGLGDIEMSQEEFDNLISLERG